MKNGYIEPSDADRLMKIYKKIDLYGNLKELLTAKEERIKVVTTNERNIK